MRTFFQTSLRDHDLPVTARRIELAGTPRSLRWPAICPNCGAPASERITVRKIFRRMLPGRSLVAHWIYVVGSAAIPFCAACAARHRQCVKTPTRAEVLLRLLVNPLMIPVVGASAFAAIIFRPAVVDTRGAPFHGVGVAIVGFLVLTAAWSAVSAWRSTRFYRIPPQTEITRACDFSDELGGFLAGRHRVYAIRNTAFADAFLAANRDRLWTDADRTRERRLRVAAAIVLLASLLVAGIVANTL